MRTAEQASVDTVIDWGIKTLQEKKPGLLVRLGDGEALAMRSVGIHSHSAMENFPWNKHLGSVPNDADKIQWIARVVESVRASDYVGIHAVDTSQGVEFKHSGKDLRKMLGTTVKQECSANIHLDMMRENKFQKLIDACEGVHLITGHPIAANFKKEFANGRDLQVRWTKLPLQCRYFRDRTDWKVWRDVITPKLATLPVAPGWLFLVGGGIPGKSIFYILRTRGGLVFDIGSVFDFWAGYLTRGKGKGPGVLCSRWKIGKDKNETSTK